MKPSPERLAGGIERLRVLLLTDEMEVGGTQRQIVHLAKGLDRRRFDPTVLYFRNRSFFVDDLEAAGVPVIQVEKRGRVDLRFVHELAARLRAGRYDVLHCFAFSGELWGAVARRLLPRAQRPALLSSVRGTYEWYRPLHWRIKRWVSAQSCAVVANSVAGAAYARERMSLAEDAIDVIYNGVEVPAGAEDAAQALRRELAGEGEALGLFVGRLVEHKNLPTLLRACALLRERGVMLRVALAGDGPLRAQLEEDIRAAGLEGRVRLLGQRSDVAALMRAADFVVLPSLREGLSNVILEAMMCGKPVIASRAGGNVELVEHDRTGLLFETTSAEALADAMQSLVEDPARRQRLAEAGRARAEERYSVPAMVRAYEQQYVEAAALRGAAAAWSSRTTLG